MLESYSFVISRCLSASLFIGFVISIECIHIPKEYTFEKVLYLVYPKDDNLFSIFLDWISGG